MLNKLMNRAVISGAFGARTAAPLVGMFSYTTFRLVLQKSRSFFLKSVFGRMMRHPF